MAFQDTQIFQDLVQKNQLPTIPVETYIANDTLIKSGMIIVCLIVITVLLIRVTKPEPTK